MKSKNIISKFEQFNEGVKPSAKHKLLKIFTDNGFIVMLHPDGVYTSKFHDGAEYIKIGYEKQLSNCYRIAIAQVYDEEKLIDDGGEDWKEDEELKNKLGQPIDLDSDDFTLKYHFFTNLTNTTSPDFFEAALKFAQFNYNLYKNNGINADEPLALLREENKLAYLSSMKVEIKSNQDIDYLVDNVCYRVYQDNKCIYIAEELFDRNLLDQFSRL